MANDLIKAADDARRILKGFKAFAEVADALEAAGQVELRVAEAQRVLADLQPKIDALQAEAAQIARANAEAKDVAGATIAQAHNQATEIKAAAKAEAAEIVAKAKADAAVVRDKAASAKLAAEAEVTGQTVRRDELLAECTALEARLATAKAEISKLLG